MMRKAIIVDLEGVILNIDYQKTFDQFAKYGINVTYDHTFKSLTERYDAGKITTDEIYQEFCRLYCNSKHLEKTQFIHSWNAMLLYIPDPNIEYLFRLKQKGHPIVLLSNINELHAAHVAEVYGEMFSHLFNKVFYSFQTGFLKPDSESYRFPVDYLMEQGIGKDKIIFIDDSSVNIRAATALDIYSLKYPMNGSNNGIFLRSLLEEKIPLKESKVVTSDTLFSLPKALCTPPELREMPKDFIPHLRIHH